MFYFAIMCVGGGCRCPRIYPNKHTMAKFKNKYRIEANRYKFWDYSAPGRYFITICTAGRKCIFGHIQNGKMILSEFGKIIEAEIRKIPEYNKRVILDEWVIMPNHIHFIIILGGYDYDNGISDIVEKIHEFSLQYQKYRSIKNPTPDQIKQYRKQRRKMVVSRIIGKFKQQTSKHINIIQNTPGTKNWQVNFHDQVIRDDRAYFNIKRYIIKNPQKWNTDRFNRDP